MKRVLCLILFLTGTGIGWVYGSYPIPSYNVPVHYLANFQESGKGQVTSNPTKGERVMVVRVRGLSSSVASIWVYSLDKQTVLGPYIVHGGETIYVEIDEREWGVLVETEDHVEVDVWIEGGSKGKGMTGEAGLWYRLPVFKPAVQSG